VLTQVEAQRPSGYQIDDQTLSLMIQWPLRFVDPKTMPQTRGFSTLVGRQLLGVCLMEVPEILERSVLAGTTPCRLRCDISQGP
jgi:hypothetical protein